VWAFVALNRKAERQGVAMARSNFDRALAANPVYAAAASKAMAVQSALDTRAKLEAAKPGWKHAPGDPVDMQRYWDGTSWTDLVHDTASDSELDL
jgi:hypothetical protein